MRGLGALYSNKPPERAISAAQGCLRGLPLTILFALAGWGFDMARIRTIKPEFFTSEDIVSLSPYARLLYVALWCEADREGRMAWKPRTFKMRYLPADNVDIDALCNEIVSAGLVKLYGEGYAYVPAFHAHQHINPREAASQLPEPPATAKTPTRKARVTDASGTREARDSDTQVGREGKGKEGKDDASRDTLFETFWKAYPRKVGKDEARKAFDKRNPTPDLLNALLAAIEVQRQSLPWQKDGGQFIPHPATWLNQGRWQDEIGSDEPQTKSIFAGAI